MNTRNALLCCLGVLLFLRASTLEITDLVDPTESRYAFVAQEMALSGNWLTPQLPFSGIVEPYLGKPPLHFWLTALSYKIFGFEEWSSRLPSFLSTIIILLAVIFYGKRAWSIEIGLEAALIAFTTPLLFLMSGASVIDVTLAATIAVSLVALYQFFGSYEGSASNKFAYIAALAAALGFLTKGPVALVLIGIPLVLFIAITKDFSKLKKFPWFSSALLFILIAAPWFILSEIQNPGFSKYFFWNENLARYLIKDYGDKYGSGHVFARGAIWVMYTLNVLPLLLLFAVAVWGKRFKSIWNETKNDKALLFALLWALSPGIFFTFARQLHSSYIIPGIPGLALFCSKVLLTEELRLKQVKFLKIFAWCVVVLPFILLPISWELESSAIFFLFGLLISLFGIVVVAQKKSHQLPAYARGSFLSGLALIAVIFAFTPHINIRKSTETILNQIAERSSGKELTVGVCTENIFSYYWVTKAWNTELTAPMHISFFKGGEIIPQGINDLLIKGADIDALKETLLDFELVSEVGRWKWYRRLGLE
jgi:hypothetical protein